MSYRACHRVFNINELAEAIFLHLSLSDLLCIVQPICRNWKNIIDTSINLQQALFRTSTCPKARLIDHRLEYAAVQAGLSYEQTVVEHPLLTKIGSGGTSLACSFGTNSEVVLCGDASWRHCLATQPPVRDICIYDSRDPLGCKTVTSDYGVLLGQLMPNEDAMRTLHASHIYAWVQWKKCSFQDGYYELKAQLREGDGVK